MCVHIHTRVYKHICIYQVGSSVPPSYISVTQIVININRAGLECRDRGLLPGGPVEIVKLPTKSTNTWKMQHWIEWEKDTCLECESWCKKIECCLVWPGVVTCALSRWEFFLPWWSFVDIHVLCVVEWLAVHCEYWFWGYRSVLASR